MVTEPPPEVKILESVLSRKEQLTVETISRGVYSQESPQRKKLARHPSKIAIFRGIHLPEVPTLVISKYRDLSSPHGDYPSYMF